MEQKLREDRYVLTRQTPGGVGEETEVVPGDDSRAGGVALGIEEAVGELPGGLQATMLSGSPTKPSLS